MRFDGSLTLNAFALVCVSERSLHIVIQETHMTACDWGVRHSRLLHFQHKHSRETRRNRLDVNVRAPLRDARSAWKHLEGDVLFQALKAGGTLVKLPRGFTASFSAACTITSVRREMESEKDLSSGCCNSGHTGRVTLLDVRCNSVPSGA